MRNYIYIFGIGLVITLSLSIKALHNRNTVLKKELNIAMNNQKAYIAENSSLKEENRVFQFTIEQLNYYNDSVLTKLNDVRRELNIKDKNLKQLQYLLSTADRTDTLVVKDTIFIDPSFRLDTIVGDQWYNVKLHMKYPNVIALSPSLKSEKYIVTSYKKETINPPKKCKLFRIFQAKHKIVEVDIVEKNPYIETTNSRFIEIIK